MHITPSEKRTIVIIGAGFSGTLTAVNILRNSQSHNLRVDDDYRIIDTHNQPTPGLFYVGPMLKARYWEAIAVPELRHHTRQLARNLTPHR